MATVKLTAAQKREREFMTLLESYEQQWQRDAAAKESKLYAMAYQDGYDAAASRYAQLLTLWERITKQGL